MSLLKRLSQSTNSIKKVLRVSPFQPQELLMSKMALFIMVAIYHSYMNLTLEIYYLVAVMVYLWQLKMTVNALAWLRHG